MEHVILWAGSLLLAGVLPFCVMMGIRFWKMKASGRGEDGVSWSACFCSGAVWLLELAVYSAGVIRLAELVMRGIEREAGGVHSPALSAVTVLFTESMVLLFLVLSALKPWRTGTSAGGVCEALWEDTAKRGDGAQRKSVIGQEGAQGETVVALLLLLARTLQGFGEAELWEEFALQLGVLSLFFLILISRERRRRGRENREDISLQRMQEDYQKNVDIQYQRTRELWHDLKNHMGVLEIMAREGRLAELADYLNSFRRDVESRMIPMKTGCTAVDAILGDKLYHARKKEIEVHMQVCDLSEILLSAVDLCAVLGNLLDNAMEACGRLPGKGRIMLRLWRQENFYYLTVVNTAPEPVRAGSGFVSEKKGYDNGVGHGLGLRSVERIAHRYGGSVVTEYEEGEFRVVVRLKEGDAD